MIMEDFPNHAKKLIEEHIHGEQEENA
jgi:hypothetical protein